jgi:hypothetical protein
MQQALAFASKALIRGLLIIIPFYLIDQTIRDPTIKPARKLRLGVQESMHVAVFRDLHR